MTDLSQATPRPWEALSPDETDMFVPIIGSNLGGLVGGAMLWPTEVDASDFDRAKANAALIVRAVNSFEAMREALARLLAYAEEMHRAANPEWSGEVFEDSDFGLARRALALANGETE